MRLNPLRYNPHPDKSKWLEYAQVLVPVVDSPNFNPKLVRELWEDLDGGVSIMGNKVILFTADGDEIVRKKESSKKSFSSAIRKLGWITGYSQLENYYNQPAIFSHQLSSLPQPKTQNWFSQSFAQKVHEPPPLKPAYGGVVINEQGKILVVEPANHFSGVVWTFPKGKLDKGETPEQTAKREVHEESGWNTQIIKKIDGEWKGSTSINQYFLMRPVGIQEEWQYQGTPKEETWRAIFVDYGCARLLVSSSHKNSAQRDVEVLDKAYLLWKSLNGLL